MARSGNDGLIYLMTRHLGSKKPEKGAESNVYSGAPARATDLFMFLALAAIVVGGLVVIGLVFKALGL